MLTELFKSVAADDVESVKAQLAELSTDQGHIGTIKDNEELPLIHASIADESFDVFEYLLTLPGVLDSRDVYERTPLAFAIQSEQPRCVNLLLENGASVDEYSAGMLPIHVAAFVGNVEIGRRLIDLDADVNARQLSVDSTPGRTPLHWCGQEGHVEFARLLIENSAEIDPVDEDGFTPIRNTIGEGHYELFMFFLDQGSDVTQCNEHGTLLHLACAWDKQEIVKVLIERGADLGAKDPDNRTAFYYAMMHASLPLVQMLIDNGVSIHDNVEPGRTALQLAISKKLTDLLEKWT